MSMTGGEALRLSANAGAVETNNNGALALIPLQWHFVVGRFIASANRILSVLMSNGRSEFSQNTTARAPSGLDLMTLGSLSTSNGTSTSTATINNWDGRIGEFWYANSDIKTNNANLTRDELVKLAYEGPFAFPHLAHSIIEYRGFRKNLASDQDQSDDVYWGGFGRP